MEENIPLVMVTNLTSSVPYVTNFWIKSTLYKYDEMRDRYINYFDSHSDMVAAFERYKEMYHILDEDDYIKWYDESINSDGDTCEGAIDL